jgi:hypothetical protein
MPLEVTLVIGARKGEPGLRLLDRFPGKSGIGVVAFDVEQWRFAKDAWWHCALAKSKGKPLLYKGGDFRQTDLLGVELPGRQSPGSLKREAAEPGRTLSQARPTTSTLWIFRSDSCISGS